MTSALCTSFGSKEWWWPWWNQIVLRQRLARWLCWGAFPKLNRFYGLTSWQNYRQKLRVDTRESYSRQQTAFVCNCIISGSLERNSDIFLTVYVSFSRLYVLFERENGIRCQLHYYRVVKASCNIFFIPSSSSMYQIANHYTRSLTTQPGN